MKRILSYLTVTALACACIFLGVRVLAGSIDTAKADETAPVSISTPEELLAIANNPAGSYILENDIDMNGVAWPAITFTGSFDGNGHIILNLNNIAISEETRLTYDGNRKKYDTHFAALFAIAENATIANVRLLNTNQAQNFQGDCFIAGIAGYATKCTITNCEITGSLRLDVFGKMFGVGGIIGYGDAVVKNCKADVTLINIDLDASTRDEQFLGCVCAAGYPDMDGCTLNLAGYISDHGYVHSGGLVGMYIIYPTSYKRKGFISNNTLTGFITFFEDNSNRRAYCEPRCGEIMDWEFTDSGNHYEFKRDERKVYTENLLPHSCENPEYDTVVTDPTCTEPGYTTYKCRSCGYEYKDTFVLPAHTFPDTYDTVVAATVETPGTARYTCVNCGATEDRELPCLTPTPVPTQTPTPTSAPENTKTDTAKKADDGGSNALWIIGGIVLFAAGAALILFTLRYRNIKRHRRARSRR